MDVNYNDAVFGELKTLHVKCGVWSKTMNVMCLVTQDNIVGIFL